MKRYVLHGIYVSDLTREHVSFRYTFWRRRSAVQMADTIEQHFFTIQPSFVLWDRWKAKRVVR